MCQHEKLKYYANENKVICLDCGRIFYGDLTFPEYLPFKYPSPMPDYPIYPIITWTKIEPHT